MAELHAAYEGICAYLGIYIERATGAGSTDHFVAKSSLPSLAYEWSNYRLACLAMNAKKNAFDDIIDPFQVPEDLFRIELVTGRIYWNEAQPELWRDRARQTIVRLGLDGGINRELRARRFGDYLKMAAGNPMDAKEYLRRYSPFVWTEVIRQGL
jgi:uncharacterized protein (TIGR02646 family)